MSVSHSSTRSGAPIRSGAGPRLFLARLRLALAARRQRHALAQLDDAALRDIGISRHEAWAEAGRPLWDVPRSWLR